MKYLEENHNYSSAEMAEWFNVKPRTYTNKKSKYLEKLKEYAQFEDLGRKGVRITKVYYDEYVRSATKKVVQQEFENSWGKHPNTLKAVAGDIYQNNKEKLLVKENTVYQATGQVKRDWYGVAKKRNGSKGYCRWVHCVFDLELGHYRYFTPKEEEIRRKLLNIFFKDSAQRICEVKELQNSYKIGEISLEDYEQLSSEILGLAENGDWDQFNQQLSDTLGNPCCYALDLEPCAWSSN